MGAHVIYVLKLPYVMKTENLSVTIFFSRVLWYMCIWENWIEITLW